MKYFISDTHFNHKGALSWNGGTVRPMFSNVNEMNDYMISKWNSVVGDNDEVYFLGDFAYKCSINKALSIFYQLNGIKHLIFGNHDNKIAFKFNCWESVSQIKQIYIIKPNGCKQYIILCHYPMLSWMHSHEGSWHLHGHTHGSIQNLNKGVKRLDVSVEIHDYTPLSKLDVINILDKY